MSGYIIPVIIGGVVIYGAVKKVNVFSVFIEGASEGMGVAVRMLPPLIILMTAIGMFRASGGLEFFTKLLAPVMEAVGLPKEVAPLVLLRPVSGSGATAILQDIVSNYGADSFAGRVASVMTGSTETTFYTLALYFGATSAENTRYALGASLFADAVSFAVSALAVRLFLGA
ncbi:MAG: spore maturation protein [Oscillospiraceae bacterium]|nr:spore maturation protein [Oscillospiraceae bacterium]MBQ3048353.1 spore maturation protein [Oscillospiraceae bacterium]MBQ9938642.1 spore maturation protein [Oscillospiraceae bacterium]